jgi:AraC-like DNA-binding protein
MLATARYFLIDTAGREQRFYSSFSPRLNHGDDTVLRVQHWLQKKGVRDVTLMGMAAYAGLEERTFLRRFRKATELNPTEYCQRLRIGKAREMLELTGRTIRQVAWDVGYQDEGSFRKVFYKVMGLKPGDYRKRFGVSQSISRPPETGLTRLPSSWLMSRIVELHEAIVVVNASMASAMADQQSAFCLPSSPFISPYHYMSGQFCEVLSRRSAGRAGPWRQGTRELLVF